MIDTHSHIHGKEFTSDIDGVLQRAADANVSRIALVGVNPDDAVTALELARLNPEVCYVITGLHPHEASQWNAYVRDRLREQVLTHPGRVVAVGEMGLDYHYDFAPKDAQKMAFRGQLKLAREVNLPISIHCREAYDDCLEILQEFYSGGKASDQPNGVLHCYFGTVEQAKQSVELGFMLGIGGASTFKKTEELHRVIEAIPLEYLVLETDAPYMAPVPYRGKRNEPSYLSHVRARIAELKSLSEADVERVTDANAFRLFRWN